MSGDFSPEQKRYLEGFVAGLQIAKAARVQGGSASPGPAEPSGPDAAHLRAQERVLKARISRMKPDEFFEDLEGRLGSAQAKALTMHHYRGKPA